jgi:uncharacterized membrane protein YtjA (UPF0391 family)
MVVAVAGLLGFSVLTGTVAWIAKTLFYIFITTLLLSLLAGLNPARRQTSVGVKFTSKR